MSNQPHKDKTNKSLAPNTRHFTHANFHSVGNTYIVNAVIYWWYSILILLGNIFMFRVKGYHILIVPTYWLRNPNPKPYLNY